MARRPEPAAGRRSLSDAREQREHRTDAPGGLDAYELRIRGLEHLISFAAARWELFAFPEVRDLVRAPGRNRFLVLYDGEPADPDAWCQLLQDAGYPAEPVGHLDGSGEAA